MESIVICSLCFRHDSAKNACLLGILLLGKYKLLKIYITIKNRIVFNKNNEKILLSRK